MWNTFVIRRIERQRQAARILDHNAILELAGLIALNPAGHLSVIPLQKRVYQWRDHCRIGACGGPRPCGARAHGTGGLNLDQTGQKLGIKRKCTTRTIVPLKQKQQPIFAKGRLQIAQRDAQLLDRDDRQREIKQGIGRERQRQPQRTCRRHEPRIKPAARGLCLAVDD